jgi:hypothetical protein
MPRKLTKNEVKKIVFNFHNEYKRCLQSFYRYDDMIQRDKYYD